MRKEYPHIQIAGKYAPPMDLNMNEDQLVMESIIGSGADIVWVNLPSPEQECWMAS
ncbi:WecB/TagA/CpsF family glycosyl transferase [Enterococcus faecium DO]|uniref:WecB/TagA/CpsF family glycosyl transferase n=1 Tax=Enterococcus faecium (strain ATCC BAA-472 / TX0016 / DO) TaxID=333849 RepID=I3U3I2_ENTFD|nr:WecB/TagA/CpsF family glycosyl transferase [Enterococcus faecium DO]